MKKYYLYLKKIIFDLFFPKICIGCQKEGSWICSDCLKDIKIIKTPFCPKCRKPTKMGEFCQVSPDQAKLDKQCCGDKFVLDGIMICAKYEEGVLREAVHNFKFNFVFDIGELLGDLMLGKLNKINREQPWTFPIFDLIVPIPLHKKRLKYRGFNQSEILAKKIADKFNIKLEAKRLKRIIHTSPQAELDREQRLKNLKNVFEWGNYIGAGRDLPLRGKNILLVDDITTTGATLEECAKVLKKEGADKIWGIVLGKG